MKNKILNEDFLRNNLPDESIDLIVTDPPYPTTKRGTSKNTTTGGLVRSELGKEGKIFKHNNIKPIEYIPEFYRILKEGSHCYIMTNHVNLQIILNTAISCGFHFIKSLIWNKGNKIMGQAYMSQFEYILFFRKGKFKKINHCGTSDILNVPNKKTKDKYGKNIHDTEKPVELMKILIDNSSNIDDIILDPFIGVGSSALAAKELKRKYIGYEIDPQYYDITQERINTYKINK
ncbi:DNA-methyltransferase [Clostridium sp. MT-14]|uniref:DNA-methyltransferase n=1 Tax=Clostridium sp. MT-14 TaxID=3348360 RepID=UPI0035F2DFAB